MSQQTKNKGRQGVSGHNEPDQTKPIWFVLPESFNPREFLPADLKRFADDARYFVNLILRGMAFRSADDNSPIRLSGKYLRRIMHYHHAPAIVRALIKGGAIERVPYTVGKASFGYRLAARFMGDKHVRVAATDPRIIGRIRAFHDRREGGETQERMLPVHHELAKLQLRLEIDAPAARQIVKDLPPESNRYDVQGILVENIIRQEFHLSVSKFGRVFNNITSLKRDLRRTLRVNGEPLLGVDLRCAQPAFLARLALDQAHHMYRKEKEREGGNILKCIYDAPDLPPEMTDLLEFGMLTQNGKLYEFLLEKIADQGNPMTREALKKRVLADVLAKKKTKHGREYPSKVGDIFEKLFPSVHKFIREFSRDGWEHENLPRELQRQESRLVIEMVAADLVAAHPGVFFITLHDAIYTTEGHIPKVTQAFERAFERTGFRMTYKVADH